MANGGGGGRPIKVLNVAEKPSVAKAVAGILSSHQGLKIREGRSRFNKIFEFNYTISGRPCFMSFTSVTGHLMELDFDERFKKWHSCDPVQLYHAPIRKYVPEVLLVSYKYIPWIPFIRSSHCDVLIMNLKTMVCQHCAAFVTYYRINYKNVADNQLLNG